MGRHSSTTRRRIRPPVVVISVLLVAALTVWFVVDFVGDNTAQGCESTTTLNVTAAPDIEPTISTAARKVSEGNNPDCYKVTVTSRESVTTAEALAVSDGSEPPDVWIPESTLWLRRAQDKGAWTTPVSGTSIASSPVVLALTEGAAAELDWPNRTLSWSDVLGPAAPAMEIGFPDPTRDVIGVSTLFGVRDLYEDAAGPTTAAMRKLSPNTASTLTDLFKRLPGASTEAKPLAAFPTSENTLLRHNVKQDSGKLVAVYALPTLPNVPALDYPYVVLPDAPADKRAAAGTFLDRLVSQDTSDALADAGFRTPDGKALRDRSQDKHVSSEPMTPPAPPEAAQVDRLLNLWSGVNLSGRVQVLLDVSGSMNEPVPGTNKNRMQVTLEAGIAGMSLFKPTTKIGWWLFSTKLDGDRDYAELLPMKTVSDQIAAGAIDTLGGVKAKENGGTGMYDSVLAAYQNARQNWEPGRINVVVVLTDGKNDDRESITLDALVAELGKLQDPRRPLKIVGIGIGPGIDAAELKRFSEATGGAAFTTEDPTKIGEVFFAALGTMLCQPPQCQPGTGG